MSDQRVCAISTIDCANGVDAAAKRITEALCRDGLVYLRNAGVTRSVIDNTVKAARDFFEQSADAKKPCARPHNAYIDASVAMDGWIGYGEEAIDKNNEKELYESYLMSQWWRTQPTFDTTTDGKHHALRSSMAQLGESCRTLTLEVLDAVATSLHMPLDRVRSWHNVKTGGDNASEVRVNYYPPVSEHLDTSKMMRFGAHTDYITISLLIQSGYGGFEARHAQTGEWMSIPKVDDAILVNVGHLMNIMTGGNVPAVEHRVTIPDGAEARGQWRCSLVCFLNPDDSALVEPLIEPPHGRSAPQPVLTRDFTTGKFYGHQFHAA